MRLRRIIGTVAFALLISACAPTEPPGDFKTGEETTPPIGCVEYKTRGGDC